MQCWCFLSNVSRIYETDGKTAWKRRHGVTVEGTRIPFGAQIHYLPTADREGQQRQKCVPKMVEGLLAGYKQHTDGKFRGEYLVYDRASYEIGKEPSIFRYIPPKKSIFQAMQPTAGMFQNFNSLFVMVIGIQKLQNSIVTERLATKRETLKLPGRGPGPGFRLVPRSNPTKLATKQNLIRWKMIFSMLHSRK